MTDAVPFIGQLIFLMEDDGLIGLDVVMTLEGAGARVLGPYSHVESALSALETLDPSEVITCAVLDYQLAGETCERVAVALHACGVPIVIHSGSGQVARNLAGKFDGPMVEKPSHPDQLLAAISMAVLSASDLSAN